MRTFRIDLLEHEQIQLQEYTNTIRQLEAERQGLYKMVLRRCRIDPNVSRQLQFPPDFSFIEDVVPEPKDVPHIIIPPTESAEHPPSFEVKSDTEQQPE
jgi:hypothetical protein